MRRWAISTNKGGALKSSVAVNLAAVMAEQGERVLIIDADNQSNAIMSFGYNPDECEVTLYEVMVKGVAPDQAIIHVEKNLDILPSGRSLMQFDFEQHEDVVRFEFLKDLLDKLEEMNRWDIVLVDSPPSTGPSMGNVLNAVDELIIPFSPEPYSMRALTIMLDLVEQFKPMNPNLKIKAVVGTKVKAMTVVHTEIMQQCRQFCDLQEIPMCETFIPETIRFAHTTYYEGKPAVLTEKKNDLVNSYRRLEKELREIG